MRKTIASVEARYDLAVKALRERDVEVARLRREAALLRRLEAERARDMAAWKTVAMHYRDVRNALMDDIHGLALEWLDGWKNMQPKRGRIARFLDNVAAAI